MFPCGIARIAGGLEFGFGRGWRLGGGRFGRGEGGCGGGFVGFGLEDRGLAGGTLFGFGGFAGEARGLALGDLGFIDGGTFGELLQCLGAGLAGERGALLKARLLVACHG